MAEALENHVPARNDILTHEVTDSDEVVVYDYQARQLLVLNDFAAGVWLLIDGKRSVSDLVDAITECVSADRDTVTKDVTSFLRELEERAIVRWQKA